MYDYIQISKINDFVFCPRSLYFHSVYEGFDDGHYKARPQVAGTIAHTAVDHKKASTCKNIIQSMEVFSHQHGIIGKIDLYDADKKELIERKRTIKKVYDGYLYQLYAQKLCLEEMGYPVQKMTLHSLTDNKKYDVHMTPENKKAFFETIDQIREYNPLKYTQFAISAKCENCIYRELCHDVV